MIEVLVFHFVGYNFQIKKRIYAFLLTQLPPILGKYFCIYVKTTLPCSLFAKGI